MVRIYIYIYINFLLESYLKMQELILKKQAMKTESICNIG